MMAIDFDEYPEVRAPARSAFDVARALERDARKARRDGDHACAADLYDRAGTEYADSGLAFHGNAESALAEEVRRSIARCRATASNLRHPTSRRAPATTPRPTCLACKKALRRYRHDGRKFNDGTPREWGDYGDNRFCGLRCGWTYACQQTSAVRK